MDGGTFAARLGKLRIAGSITSRMPVVRPEKPDRNRALMLKFKYGTMTPEEGRAFHEDMKRLIYKVMHRANVVSDWDDVYQEIWRKIVRSRHTWKEWKGTMVSTWITIVAMSVVNTQKARAGRYRSRYVAFEDVAGQDRETGGARSDAMDSVASGDGSEDGEDGIGRYLLDDQLAGLMDSLEPSERALVDAARQLDDESRRSGGRLSFGELRSRLGYSQPEFNQVLYSVRGKIAAFFPGWRRGEDDEKAGADDSDGGSGLLALF